jgi:purine-binding chemotaxis protein CheW
MERSDLKPYPEVSMSPTHSPTAYSTAVSKAGQTVLLATFFVRDTLCALDAAGVQEVIRVGPITPVRYAPKEVLGIVNLRGKIVTIVDLALRLGFPGSKTTGESRIFIVEDRHEFIGLLVDRVDEVVEVDRGEWLPAPANVRSEQAGFFMGVCRAHGRVVTLLDAGQILAEA